MCEQVAGNGGEERKKAPLGPGPRLEGSPLWAGPRAAGEKGFGLNPGEQTNPQAELLIQMGGGGGGIYLKLGGGNWGNPTKGQPWGGLQPAQNQVRQGGRECPTPVPNHQCRKTSASDGKSQ